VGDDNASCGADGDVRDVDVTDEHVQRRAGALGDKELALHECDGKQFKSR
jgi:hypothetical protein